MGIISCHVLVTGLNILSTLSVIILTKMLGGETFIAEETGLEKLVTFLKVTKPRGRGGD